MGDTDPLYYYCGSPLWDANITWNTDNPDFTDCFQKTVLVWVPCIWLWLFSLLELYYIYSSKTRLIPWTALNIIKTVVNLLLITLCIIDFAWAVDSESAGRLPVFPADIYTPLIKCATLVLSLVLLIAGKRRGIRSSGVLFIFWLLLSICGAVTYRTQIMRATDPVESVNTFTFTTYMIYYPLVIFMLFLNCFSDAPPTYEASELKSEKPSPELGASFVSMLTFSWFDKLAILGYRRSLEVKDLWDLKPEDRSSSVVPRWDKFWNKAVSKALKNSAETTDKAEFSKSKENVEIKRAPKKKQISILPTLVKTFGWTFLSGSVLKLVQDMLTFISPQLLSALIDFVESDDYVWRGYLYAGLMTASAFVQTFFLSQYFHRMYIVGMRIRTAIVSTVYRKALRISNAARKESTVGEIVNLMAVDAQRFMDLTSYLNMLWSAPLQIALAIYFLYNILGPSVFAGLAVMVLLIPINGFLASKTRTLQVAQMKNKDKRVKLMNEILSGIKVLKLYAWEPSFQNQVEDIRDKEIEVLKKAAYLGAGTSFLWTCAPLLVSLTSFAVFVLSDPNNILDAQKAFVSLSLFNIMRMPMSILPMMIVAVVQASVSLKRMNKFMNAEELNPDAVTHDPNEQNPIVVKDGSFSWGVDEKPVLKNISFEVEEGSLVAVVGMVGSGKSSLISAILGEMDKLSGKVNTKGSIAYVPQQAWIQNAILRQNIIFGGAEEESRYNQVIDSCALRPDFDILPAGDNTEIGEKVGSIKQKKNEIIFTPCCAPLIIISLIQ
ncbi:multidrug resistance-associated protein 1-like isoform X2 [Artemia franciscana]|uniref:multidrug resistance-associated protein 1-like isoform X2 n=1 Tax=Artemia franciscana TaxID=6661 RepID=UPI0032DA3BB8